MNHNKQANFPRGGLKRTGERLMLKAMQVIAWRIQVTLIGNRRTGWGLWYWWQMSAEWRDWADEKHGLNDPYETVSEEIYTASRG